MALTDLLWACPLCGRDRGLRPVRRGVRCHACHARFERHHGARIRAIMSDGVAIVRAPAAWVDSLPPPDRLLDHVAPDGTVRRARVTARLADRFQPVRLEGAYANRIERYGPPSAGTLEMGLEGLIFRPGREGDVHWDFGALRAVQASSSTLQVVGPDHTIAAFRFHDDSVWLWEQLLAAALRRHYRRAGLGEIVEFGPRIVTA